MEVQEIPCKAECPDKKLLRTSLQGKLRILQARLPRTMLFLPVGALAALARANRMRSPAVSFRPEQSRSGLCRGGQAEMRLCFRWIWCLRAQTALLEQPDHQAQRYCVADGGLVGVSDASRG